MRERLMKGIGSLALCAVLAAAPAAQAARGGHSMEPGNFGINLDAAVSLEDVQVHKGESGTNIQIRGSAPFMYTAYSSEGSLYVLDLPGVDVGALEDAIEVGTPEVSGINLSDPDPEAGIRYSRLEIHLGPRGGEAKASMDPNLPNTLHIYVPRSAEVRAAKPSPVVLPEGTAISGSEDRFRPEDLLAAAGGPVPEVTLGRSHASAPSGPSAGLLEDIRITPRGEVLAVDLVADGVLEYSSFHVPNPDRLVVDLRGVHEKVRSGAILVGANGVSRIRVAQHQPDPQPVVRVVLDASEALDHTVQRHAKGLTLFVTNHGPQALAGLVEDSGSVSPGSAPSASSDVNDLLASAEALGRMDAPANDSESVRRNNPPARNDELYETQTATSPEVPASLRPSFEPKVLGGEELTYTGRPISLDLRNAPIVDIFRLFHELSGLNIVVDPSVGDRTITIDVDNVPWDQVLDLVLKSHGLGKTFEGNVLRIAPANKLAQEEREQQQLRDAKEQAQPLRTVTRTLSYARAEEVEQIINRVVQSGRSGGGSAQALSIVDERTNTLILRDTDTNLEEINELIDQLDVPARQVLIESRIVAAEKNWSQSFGVRWGFDYVASPEFGNQTDFNFPNSMVTNYALNLPQQGAQQIELAFSNILNTFQLNVALDASELEGTSRTISAPRIIAQNNEAASIENGTQLPIVSTTATEIDVRFVSASLRLEVTPQITKDDTVILELTVENNSISGVTVGDVPGITTQEASTTVLVPNGGTTVIGGIYKLDEGDEENRIPVLHRIPLLGWLFKNKGRRSQNQELMIFVTPRILN